MGETYLPAGFWLMVALMAAFAVWMCLSTIGAAIEYERHRQTLGQEVKDLRNRYSLSYPGTIIRPDSVAKRDSGRKAA